MANVPLKVGRFPTAVAPEVASACKMLSGEAVAVAGPGAASVSAEASAAESALPPPQEASNRAEA